jgi:RNA-directed DNA polymerase
MNRKRQKTLNETFAELTSGEAARQLGGGTELKTPTTTTEIPRIAKVMEEAVEKGNAKKALERVLQNKGASGIDGMRTEQLPGYLRANWKRVKQELLSGTYAPQPLRRVEIPKSSGEGMRKLGIPTVLDRFVQQAMQQVLQRHLDKTFSESSYGFRPGRSAHQAVEQAQKYVGSGLRWVVDIDLEKFFDRVNHDILMGLLAARIEDKSALKIVRKYLQAGVLEEGLVKPTVEGQPQGGPLSPLLSNVMLDVLDKELERRGHKFVRYADDCNVYVASQRAGERVMESITKFLHRKLKLQINKEKSAVDKPQRRKVLGFSFTYGENPRRRLAPQAIAKMKKRVRELTRKTKGISLEKVIERLAKYLTGWRGYFGFCETPSILAVLDRWIRRRLRRLVWIQWKRGYKRYAELKARGVGQDLATQTVSSPHGAWRLSNSPALTIAFPNKYFNKVGLPQLVT